MKYLHHLATALFFGGIGAYATAQDPSPMAREVSTRPMVPPESETVKHVLLSDGRILVGEVSPHKDGGWNVQQKLGRIRIDADDVEGLFPSLKAIYDHKRENLPPRDIQERMRLYRWCMSQNLLTDAREQLGAILALSPDHEEAKASMGLLEIRMTRQDTRVDNQIVRTTATQPVDNTLREMDPVFLNRALRDMAVRTSPIIFDLPEALALKRAQEFNQYVHPLVQQYCAGCHNERTPNGFPLVAVTGRAARDPAILRSNLDATLMLVNTDNLMQSPLLVNSLLPHKPNNRAIFPGPNHPAYRLISNWVSNLQHRGLGNVRTTRNDQPPGPDADPSPFGAPMNDYPAQSASSGFAVEGRLAEDRSQRPSLPIEANPDVLRSPRSQSPGQGLEHAEPAMPGRIVPGSYNGGSPLPPKGTKFPLPLPAGASPDELLRSLQAEEAERDAREAATIRKKVVIDQDDDDDDDDEAAMPPLPSRADKPAAADKSDTPEKSKKPVKIDQKLLEQFILQRRGGG